MEIESRDNAAQIARTNDHSDLTSRNLLAEVHRLHVSSFNRNNSDNTASVVLGVNADKKGIALADQTMAQGDQLQQYLEKGGDFSDPAGKKLGEKFVAQLRREAEDLKKDRAGAQEFVGKEMPEAARQQALKDSGDISDAAKKLADPNASDKDRTEAMSQIMRSADSITKGLHDSTGKAGNDQKSAVAESAVIAGDIKALQGANLTAEQKTQLVNDIASKAGLIKNELNDSPNEQNEIKHDNVALQSGAKLEATLRYAMAHPGHAGRALEQIKSGLNGLNNGEGTGAFEAVKIDRQQDMVTEPIYMSANSADNAEHNAGIIEFTNPYVSVQRRSRV